LSLAVMSMMAQKPAVSSVIFLVSMVITLAMDPLGSDGWPSICPAD
jgi:hypothetical protein